MAGDLNSRTPFTIVSKQNKMGIRFRSSALFNFRGMKMQYLVSYKCVGRRCVLCNVIYFQTEIPSLEIIRLLYVSDKSQEEAS